MSDDRCRTCRTDLSLAPWCERKPGHVCQPCSHAECDAGFFERNTA